MAEKKHKKRIWNEKTRLILAGIFFAMIFCWMAVGVYFFLLKAPASLYVLPENPKQGDTVFIKIKTDAPLVVGSFAGEKLVFFKKADSHEWISFLGIDAGHQPGDYEVSVETLYAERMSKIIKVGEADFSSAASMPAPSQQRTGVSQENAVKNIVTNDNPALKEVLNNFTEKPYFNSSFFYPLKDIEKKGISFGKFINFTKYTLQHLGVDLEASKDTEIYAVNDGKVVLTQELSNYGKTIVIDHGLDIFSMYLHLDNFKVLEGQIVKRGQVIGFSGDTGYVTAPHLHFSVRVQNSRVDPVAFIDATKKMDDSFILADFMQAVLQIIDKRF